MDELLKNKTKDEIIKSLENYKTCSSGISPECLKIEHKDYFKGFKCLPCYKHGLKDYYEDNKEKYRKVCLDYYYKAKANGKYHYQSRLMTKTKNREEILKLLNGLEPLNEVKDEVKEETQTPKDEPVITFVDEVRPDEVRPDEEDQNSLTKTKLKLLTLVQLKEMCRTHNVKVKGNKDVLIERILTKLELDN